MADIPRCKNKHCEKYADGGDVVLAGEKQTHFVFFCRVCDSVQVVTKKEGWRAAEQTRHYRTHGRPEYAKQIAHFFQGKNNR